LGSRVPIWAAVLAILVLSASIWGGISGLRIPYPGHHQDRGDAYSEYIIRNTVINNVVGRENQGGSLIWTKGYFPENGVSEDHKIDYFPDKTIRYHSNRGLQQSVYTLIAKAAGNAFVKNPDRLFGFFRFVNCLILTSCFAVFFLAIAGRRPAFLAATAAMVLSSGAALFGANLYFMYWLMFTPLLAAPLLFSGRTTAYVAAAFVGGLAYFVVRYEFATTFTMMWLLPVILARSDRPRAMIMLGAAVFAAIVASFVLAIVMHLLNVAAIEHTNMSGAAAFVFEKLRMRVSSFDSVPLPFTVGFVKNILFRWGEPALAIKDVISLSKALVLVIFAWFCVTDRSLLWRLVAAWAVLTYASWFVLAYQHSMQHFHYDAMLFSCSITLVVVARLVARQDGLAIAVQAGAPLA
jgi:hypothetical protein